MIANTAPIAYAYEGAYRLTGGLMKVSVQISGDPLAAGIELQITDLANQLVTTVAKVEAEASADELAQLRSQIEMLGARVNVLDAQRITTVAQNTTLASRLAASVTTAAITANAVTAR